MPSTELDDLKVMAENITAKTEPVKYLVNQLKFTEANTAYPSLFRIERHTGGTGGHYKAIFVGTEDPARSFLNGILEGRCAALRRW